MGDRPDLLLVGEPALFGAVVPAGLLYAITSLSASVAPIGDAVALVWFVAIAIGFAALGEGRELPTESLLGGGIVGTIAGFWAFSALVGWSFVMFALVPIAVMAAVTGAWIAYERGRRTAGAAEPPVGSWRHVFAILLAVPLAFVALLIGA